MFSRRTERPPRRGQAMIEFALVLPLLVLLLVMAIDFGRVFFGWVALQNTVRIGADFAAQHWEAWPDDPSGPSVQARADYQSVMINDLQATNCTYATPLPEPVFEDIDSPADGLNWGDLAHVSLTCDFELITPLAENIFGGPVTIRAESTFMLHGTATGTIPEPPPIPCEKPVAIISSNPPPTTGGRILIDGSDPDLIVEFTDDTAYTASCALDVRLWRVTPGTDTSADPIWSYEFPPHTGGGFTQYTVELTVTTDEGTDTETVQVRVSQ